MLEQFPLERSCDIVPTSSRPSVWKPLFIADWIGALFLHYEIDAERLQPFVPFKLDLWNERAFVSLVAFTMRGMRLATLGALGAWMCRPVATHEFLNLRTYVRHGGESGICFLTEWLPNRLSLLLGPTVYGLPYRRAAICYSQDGIRLRGSVTTRRGCVRYDGELDEAGFTECASGSLDEFLLEHYVAFNAGHFSTSMAPTARRVFRVLHDPWPQTRAEVRIVEDSLLRNNTLWWPHARFASANYSPGVQGVRMSAPRRITGT